MGMKTERIPVPGSMADPPCAGLFGRNRDRCSGACKLEAQTPGPPGSRCQLRILEVLDGLTQPTTLQRALDRVPATR